MYKSRILSNKRRLLPVLPLLIGTLVTGCGGGSSGGDTPLAEEQMPAGPLTPTEDLTEPAGGQVGSTQDQIPPTEEPIIPTQGEVTPTEEPVIPVQGQVPSNEGPANPMFNTTLAALAGVWDDTSEEAFGTDESYTVIRADGTGSSYDFLGDSLDDLNDCFFKEDFLITDQGNGLFDVVFVEEMLEPETTSVILERSGDMLTVIDPEGIDPTITNPLAGQAESDFVPLCDFDGNLL